MTLRSQLLANKVEHVFHPATNASPEAKAAVIQKVISTHEALDNGSKKELEAVITKAVSILPASAQVEFVKYATQATPASLPDSNETDSEDDQTSTELTNANDLFGADEVVIMSPVNPDPFTSTDTNVSPVIDTLDNDSFVMVSPINTTNSTNTEVSTNLASADDLFGADEVVMVSNTSFQAEI